MPAVEIYTTPFCAFCFHAKKLLADKGISFDEIDVMMSPEKRLEMIDRAAGEASVPQIFVDGEHIGDCDELYRLESQGALDARLGLAAAAPGPDHG